MSVAWRISAGAVDERARAGLAAAEGRRRGRLEHLALEQAAEVDRDVVALDVEEGGALLGLVARQAGQAAVVSVWVLVTVVTVASAP